jgi:glyoxylase-like metal-dependent hydrolase (beta-lactamase superfamily II)
MTPQVHSFHDTATGSFTHLVWDHDGGHAAIIDPVLDFDLASARTGTDSAARVLAFARERGLAIDWILETHAHADHLSAADWLKAQTGARTGIGRGIIGVQRHFAPLFGFEAGFRCDGSQFDRLFDDGDMLAIGTLQARLLATPGHTADGMTCIVGNAAFIGDTLFAPDLGTARCDFPGGDARTLHRSIRRLLELPPATRLFLCHDYPPATRPPQPHATVAAQQAGNSHLADGFAEEAYVALRQARDETLPVPRLLLPALQVNLRAGALPPADSDGIRRLRLPLDTLGIPGAAG